MKKFVIVTDSCSDLDKKLRKKYDIDYIPMYLTYKNGEESKDIPASLDWEFISMKDFYDLLKKGVQIKTAQILKETYYEKFEEYIKNGYDILSISCSSGLSVSFSNSQGARDQLLEKYPDSKIITIDSKNACFGLGLLCITASEMRKEGKSIEEVAEYIEKHKLEMNQLCTVDSLKYLQRAGRVSTTSAVFGSLLQVKPIIISDVVGMNVAVEKVMGRKKSFERIVDLFVERYQKNPYQKIGISHADCEADFKTFVSMIKEKMPDKKVEVIETTFGPIIGATTGPGTVVMYFFGKEVTFDSTKQK